MDNFNKLAVEAYHTAAEKGFWRLPEEMQHKLISRGFTAEEIDHFIRLEFSQKLMLISSEVYEAFENLRKGGDYHKPPKHDVDWFIKNWDRFTDEQYQEAYRETFKGNFWEEIADVIIRIADLAGREDVDMDFLIRAKMRYNKSRPAKHGKKF